MITTQDSMLLIETVQKLMNIFSVFFKELPEMNSQNISSTQKAVNALKFYVKLRKFLKYINDNKQSLFDDIKYLEERVSLFRTDLDGMLQFY